MIILIASPAFTPNVRLLLLLDLLFAGKVVFELFKPAVVVETDEVAKVAEVVLAVCNVDRLVKNYY
jgi:hypothetical protein